MQASDGVWAEPVEDKQFPRLRRNKPEHQVSIWAQGELVKICLYVPDTVSWALWQNGNRKNVTLCHEEP